jgi:hypothetical protein
MAADPGPAPTREACSAAVLTSGSTTGRAVCSAFLAAMAVYGIPDEVL